MAVVYHTNYINWFEWARTELIRACGYPYHLVEEQGLLLPVLEVGAQFKQPAVYDEVVTVYTRVNACTNVRLEFEYEVRRGAPELGGQERQTDAGAVRPAYEQAGPAAEQLAALCDKPEGELLAAGFSKHMWVTRDWKPARLERQLPELHRLLQTTFIGAFTKS
jgi:acyl-CoA thioester hydrolase